MKKQTQEQQQQKDAQESNSTEWIVLSVVTLNQSVKPSCQNARFQNGLKKPMTQLHAFLLRDTLLSQGHK